MPSRCDMLCRDPIGVSPGIQTGGCEWVVAGNVSIHCKLERTSQKAPKSWRPSRDACDAGTSGTDPALVPTLCLLAHSCAYYAYYIRTELEESIRGGLQKVSATQV
jgi:hypothetical protein